VNRLASIAAITTIVAASQAGAQTSPSPSPPPTEQGTTEEEVLYAMLIKAAIKNLEANIQATGRESGEIDKLLRAIAGVSVKDIKAYGICGGPNSEVRKIAGNLCKKT
jgi:hypothetical protein